MEDVCNLALVLAHTTQVLSVLSITFRYLFSTLHLFIIPYLSSVKMFWSAVFYCSHILLYVACPLSRSQRIEDTCIIAIAPTFLAFGF